MGSVSIADAGQLVKHSLAFAVLMKDEELEDVVITFMEVLQQRKKLRGD